MSTREWCLLLSASGMPSTYRNVKCSKCGELMGNSNMTRHMSRIYGIEVPPKGDSTNTSSQISTRDSSPVWSTAQSAFPRREVQPLTLNDIVRSAALCMLKRDEHNSLPTLRSYLAVRFPEIPSDMREPIILTTYTAAQKLCISLNELNISLHR